MSSKCPHTHLQTDVSSHATTAKFTRVPYSKRIAATTPSGRDTLADQKTPPEEATTFPAPLVLPDDALALDPKEPPQSLRSWTQEKSRNPLTPERKTIYVAEIPSLTKPVIFMADWATPTTITARSETTSSIAPPSVEEIVAYLSAFYHPLPVKLLPQSLSFVPWPPSSTRSSSRLAHVGLCIGTSVTQIPTRPCPDGVFPRQLGLNPILDAAIDALPPDAHSLVLVVEQDLYEDEEDDFCCGRAYGGSRISVVSAARYHPLLDGVDGVDREHMWPASHCGEFVEGVCAGEVTSMPRGKGRGAKKGKGVVRDKGEEGVWETPLGAAVKAARVLSEAKGEEDLHGLWLSRVARTVSHELGHCFTLAHCVYYACVMQSTAGVHEDLRQPPYLCAVCLAKVVRAVGAVAEPGVDEEQIVIQRYRTLQKFCEGWLRVGMFAGFHAWLGKRLEMLEMP
ncbi:hypothetical protein B0T19DRAFT_385491 [Cercophora scortea]|uniref:Archaemetzincin-2 n=1 Tax=Cercophora scortea TaxID=314031 RepID=A0AAE0IDK5_9PEZI|nr:hypothetical protein B0T19DRAFT_385491 [Cercophora scortea]